MRTDTPRLPAPICVCVFRRLVAPPRRSLPGRAGNRPLGFPVLPRARTAVPGLPAGRVLPFRLPPESRLRFAVRPQDFPSVTRRCRDRAGCTRRWNWDSARWLSRPQRPRLRLRSRVPSWLLLSGVRLVSPSLKCAYSCTNVANSSALVCPGSSANRLAVMPCRRRGRFLVVFDARCPEPARTARKRSR